MQALLQSDDVRSLTLIVGTCVVGFAMAWPSPALVRVAFVGAATVGLAAWVLAGHQALEDVSRSDDRASSNLYAGKGRSPAPYAMLLHPEASSVIASLSNVSRPGRRTSVHAVVLATEAVVQAYHAVLSAPAPLEAKARGTSGTDDLRERTVAALDALQALRMETGSRGPASVVAASAERRLRRLFVRFRQIASNKLRAPGLYGAPYPFDPSDDHRSLR